MIKRKLTIVVIIAMLTFSMSLSCSFANTEKEPGQIVTDQILMPSDFEETENTDIAEVPKDILLDSPAEVVKETLDNGTVLVVDDTNSDADLKTIGNLLGEDYTPEDKGELQAIQGAYLTSDGQGGYNISEVIAEIVPPSIDDSDKQESVPTETLETALEDIVENDQIDIEEIYKDEETKKTDPTKIEMVNDTTKARLQAGSVTGNSFMDKTANFNLYGFTGTTTVAGYTKKADYWVKASATKVTGYLAKVKTSKTTTYDAFQGIITVAPTTKFKVVQYNTQLATPQKARYTSLEESYLKSGSKSFSVSLSLSASQGGAGASASYACTFDPDGQSITNHIGNKYTQWWQAYPSAPKKGASYRIKPSMIIKAKDGTKTTANAYVTLSYQKVSGAFGTFKSDTDKKINLKFKNHKKV